MNIFSRKKAVVQPVEHVPVLTLLVAEDPDGYQTRNIFGTIYYRESSAHSWKPISQKVAKRTTRRNNFPV